LRTPRLSTNHTTAQISATPPRMVTVVGDGGGHHRGHRERQGDEHVVEAEDPAADVVGNEDLQSIRGQHPLGPAAQVRDTDRHRGDRERGRRPKCHVPEPEHREGEPDRGEEPAVPWARDPVAEEGSDQRAHPTSGHQEPEADVARLEDVERHHRDEGEEARRGTEPELDGQQGKDPMVPPCEAPRLSGGLDRAGVLVDFGPCLREPPPDRHEQRGRDQE
jgi:hypothetical protein